MFIKKIFEDNIDEGVHKQFIRFGKGKFNKRAVINIKRNSIIKIKTSFEFANDLVLFISHLAHSFEVKGILLSKNKIEIPEYNRRKKNNLFVYSIDRKMNSDSLRDLVSKSYYTLFDCISEDRSIDLKIKKKLPRPSQKAGVKVNEKFCQLNLDKKYWPDVHKEFLFDLPQEVKKVHIEHDYIIKDIKIPKGIEKDFEKIRLRAKRIGKIIRRINADKKEIIKEKDFEA